MIQLPRLDRLDVDEYGLFPGTEARPGLHVEFKPGVTLVLGANGLGKTTLVTLIYRMLTGPSDIPTLSVGGELGGRRLDARALLQQERRIFANRVKDAAQSARARLIFWLGESRIEVTRNLQTLEATDLRVDRGAAGADAGNICRTGHYTRALVQFRRLDLGPAAPRVLLRRPSCARMGRVRSTTAAASTLLTARRGARVDASVASSA